MIITFQGASDDLVEVGIPGAKYGGDEYNVYPEGEYAGTWSVGGKMLVDAYYDGTWSFAPRQNDEGEDIPFKLQVYGALSEMAINDYTTVLAIEVPEGTKVFKVDGRGR